MIRRKHPDIDRLYCKAPAMFDEWYFVIEELFPDWEEPELNLNDSYEERLRKLDL